MSWSVDFHDEFVPEFAICIDKSRTKYLPSLTC